MWLKVLSPQDPTYRAMQEAYKVGTLLRVEDPNSDSESSHIDVEESHTRSLDPFDPDVYLDALFGPLYFKLERIQKDGDSGPRFPDYIGLHLLASQPSLAAVHRLEDSTSGAANLWRCWRSTDEWHLLESLESSELFRGSLSRGV